VHGLQKKLEFNGLVGTVIREVGADRWCVELDEDRKELSLHLKNLEFAQMGVFPSDATASPTQTQSKHNRIPEQEPDSNSTVDHLENGAAVCKLHGLEVCGACGMDLRVLNSRLGVSAPQLATLSIKARRLGAVDDGLYDLDPSLLRAICDFQPRAEWGGRGPLQQAFTQNFSMREKLMSNVDSRPTIDQDLTFYVRETHLCVASMIEVNKCRSRYSSVAPKFLTKSPGKRQWKMK